MKITQVDLYEVEIPPIPPIAKYVPKIYDITLCRVQTDEGIEGWGEYLGTRSTARGDGAVLHRSRGVGVRPIRPTRWVHLCAVGHHRANVWHSCPPLFRSEGTR